MKVLNRLMIYKKWIILFLVLVVIGVVVWNSKFARRYLPCQGGVPHHAPHPVSGETCPFIANIGGNKIAVPQHYLLGPVGYKGINIWNAKSYDQRPKNKSFDNTLDDFAIRIRLSDFTPLLTQKDLEDYRNSRLPRAKPPFKNRWIHVGFDTNNPRNIPFDQINFDYTINANLKDEQEGPYIQKPDIWGLKHYVSIKEPSFEHRQQEFFYDAKDKTTFVRCENSMYKVPPHDALVFCEIYFYIPEMKISVVVDSIDFKEDLARWREIKAGVRKVAHSFIVN